MRSYEKIISATGVISLLVMTAEPCKARSSADHLPLIEDGPVASTGTPEVLADRRVVFRLRAPGAQAVALDIAGWTPKPLSADSDGTWSITIGPLEPEVYSYTFLVDDVSTVDPKNIADRLSVGLKKGQFEISGSPPRFDELQNVRHGTVEIQYYASSAQRRQRAVYVYRPPASVTLPGRELPVLYLYHGATQNESSWMSDGRAAIILDNLIAAGKAKPMIVVMPSGNVLVATTGGGIADSKVLEHELLDDLMPFIETTYPVRSGRMSRAIAGLSQGAGTAINIGFRHLDKFAFIGEFASGLLGGSSPPLGTISDKLLVGELESGMFDWDRITPTLYTKLTASRTRPEALFMSVGTEDPRLRYQVAAFADLRAHGVCAVFRTYVGGHETRVFRRSLSEFAPLLFQNASLSQKKCDESSLKQVPTSQAGVRSTRVVHHPSGELLGIQGRMSQGPAQHRSRFP